jgi:TolB-like protein/Tfp pilus assembly protein PilF
MPPEIFRFEGFELDRGAYELRRAGRTVHIERIPLDLLFLLAERQGKLVAREEIIERIWGRDAFLDTDNSINTAIRKIREALSENPNAPRFLVTVPSKGYRFVAAMKDAGATLGGGAPEAERPARVMLVVLPFANLSGDPGQDYFSDGLTEETITDLGQLAPDRLGVIARTSAMAYRGTRKTIAQIGRELAADFALEGSVRRDGERIRITAQLIRTSDQTHVWAEQYDRGLKDVLAVQSELGRAISERVQVKLTPEKSAEREQAPAMNQAAYDAFLHGRFHTWKVTRPSIEKAIEYYRQATRIDPRMAIAYAGMADAYAILPITSDVAPHEAFPKAEEAVMEALRIDRDLAEAHCVLAAIHFWHGWRWAASEESARRAIARNQSCALAHLRYGHMLSNTERHQEAIEQAELARQLDPFSLITNTMCAQFRYQAGRYDEAIPFLNRTFELEPNFWVAHLLMAKLHQLRGQHEEAIVSAQNAHDFSGGNTEARSLAGYSYGAMGRREQAERALAELESIRKERYVPAYNIAAVCLGLDDVEATIRWLEKAYQDRDVHVVFLHVEPRWARLKDEPRFQSLLRRAGLSREQGAKIEAGFA